MTATLARTRVTRSRKAPAPALEARARSALAWLKRHSNSATRRAMARYGIPAGNALGVAMRDIKALGKELGPDHDLAAALWNTGIYEARMAASFIDDPAQVTSAQMDRWCREFDNWAYCDAFSFNLFDRTAHAWAKVAQWSGRRSEFEKRTAFALLWSLTVHDKRAGNEPFLEGLVLVEREANDERHFVKKAVNMALRAIGKRNLALHTAAVDVAQRLTESPGSTARWVGSDALRELSSPALLKRLKARRPI